MLYALLLALAIFLSAGFLVLTAYEKKRGGARFLESYRGRLDREVGRLVFIAEHVDFAAFFRDMVRMGSERVAHDLATWTLVAVRSVERLLTRVVKHLRGRRSLMQAVTPTTAPSSSFVGTLSDFKTTLRNSRPAVEPTTQRVMG